MNQPSDHTQQLKDSFKVLKMTPEGQMVMEYLQALFLYPNPSLSSLFCVEKLSNDELLGHHRVVLHMLSMMEQD